jgi:hypothetical protein
MSQYSLTDHYTGTLVLLFMPKKIRDTCLNKKNDSEALCFNPIAHILVSWWHWRETSILRGDCFGPGVPVEIERKSIESTIRNVGDWKSKSHAYSSSTNGFVIWKSKSHACFK